MSRLFCSCLLFGLCGCLAQDETIDFSDTQLTRLLTSDSSKTWLLTSRLLDNQQLIKDCEMDDLLIFQTPGMSQDTALVSFLTGPILCPEQSDSIIFRGVWEIIDTASHPLLRLVINDDTSVVSIDYITSQLFESTQLKEGKSIKEEFVAIDP